MDRSVDQKPVTGTSGTRTVSSSGAPRTGSGQPVTMIAARTLAMNANRMEARTPVLARVDDEETEGAGGR